MSNVNLNRRMVQLIPMSHYVNKKSGGNSWSRNMHSAVSSNISLEKMMSLHKAHDTSLYKFSVKKGSSAIRFRAKATKRSRYNLKSFLN